MAARYVEAIGAGASKLDSLIAALRAAEAKVAELKRQIAELDSTPALDMLADNRMGKHFAERAKYWQKVLAGEVPLARQALKALLARSVSFDGRVLQGALKTGALLGRIVSLVPRKGLEPPQCCHR